MRRTALGLLALMSVGCERPSHQDQWEPEQDYVPRFETAPQCPSPSSPQAVTYQESGGASNAVMWWMLMNAASSGGRDNYYERHVEHHHHYVQEPSRAAWMREKVMPAQVPMRVARPTTTSYPSSASRPNTSNTSRTSSTTTTTRSSTNSTYAPTRSAPGVMKPSSVGFRSSPPPSAPAPTRSAPGVMKPSSVGFRSTPAPSIRTSSPSPSRSR